jgi:hypothetical protein
MRLFIIITLLFAYHYADANISKLDNEAHSKDSVCFSYSFAKGDTLIYEVHSVDSISVDYGIPLVKERYEEIMIVCDSVSESGNFYLSQTLIDYRSFEAELKPNAETVKRSDHPWVGKTVHIQIDSLGDRLKVMPAYSDEMIQSPGGGFDPYILFSLKESCKSVGESWLVDGTDELVENANPPPMLTYSALFRARSEIDTLGYSCNAFEYVKTGQGALESLFNGKLIKVSNVINSFGIMYISKEYKIPVHYYATIEQKLAFHLVESEEIPALHFITTFYTLIDHRKRK